MKAFKSFDLFQKVSNKEMVKSTIFGSLLSVTAITLMIYLFCREIITFYNGEIKKDTVVIQDANPSEMIDLDLNMEFSHLPCNLVSLDQEDSLGNHDFDISDTIKKYRVIPKQGKSEFRNAGQNAPLLYKALEANETCSISGHIKISKVPGSFHISFHNYRPLYSQLRREKPDLAKNIKVAHNLKYLYFGSLNWKKIRKFGLTPRSFTHIGELPNFMGDNVSNDYAYFLKIIPYELIDENWGSTLYYYQYSLSTKKMPFSAGMDDMPIVYVKYEFSPVTMRVTIKKRDFLHFLTHVCAIIGGVFMVFSMLNQIFSSVFDSDKN
ncbi:MAG: endoplasmic reticulum-Golgi intermediate compartment protein [archaeon]|nr:endoplasmic reticulum-Golgi intermediate compartment protein [archaeon]